MVPFARWGDDRKVRKSAAWASVNAAIALIMAQSTSEMVAHAVVAPACAKQSAACREDVAGIPELWDYWVRVITHSLRSSGY